ncbi:MAG: hypothetical protein AAF699_21430, partial [Pseudomonadota bacterium]
MARQLVSRFNGPLRMDVHRARRQSIVVPVGDGAERYVDMLGQRLTSKQRRLIATLSDSLSKFLESGSVFTQRNREVSIIC